MLFYFELVQGMRNIKGDREKCHTSCKLRETVDTFSVAYLNMTSVVTDRTTSHLHLSLACGQVKVILSSTVDGLVV